MSSKELKLEIMEECLKTIITRENNHYLQMDGPPKQQLSELGQLAKDALDKCRKLDLEDRKKCCTCKHHYWDDVGNHRSYFMCKLGNRTSDRFGDYECWVDNENKY